MADETRAITGQSAPKRRLAAPVLQPTENLRPIPGVPGAVFVPPRAPDRGLQILAAQLSNGGDRLSANLRVEADRSANEAIARGRRERDLEGAGTASAKLAEPGNEALRGNDPFVQWGYDESSGKIDAAGARDLAMRVLTEGDTPLHEMTTEGIAKVIGDTFKAAMPEGAGASDAYLAGFHSVAEGAQVEAMHAVVEQRGKRFHEVELAKYGELSSTAMQSSWTHHEPEEYYAAGASQIELRAQYFGQTHESATRDWVESGLLQLDEILEKNPHVTDREIQNYTDIMRRLANNSPAIRKQINTGTNSLHRVIAARETAAREKANRDRIALKAEAKVQLESDVDAAQYQYMQATLAFEVAGRGGDAAAWAEARTRRDEASAQLTAVMGSAGAIKYERAAETHAATRGTSPVSRQNSIRRAIAFASFTTMKQLDDAGLFNETPEFQTQMLSLFEASKERREVLRSPKVAAHRALFTDAYKRLGGLPPTFEESFAASFTNQNTEDKIERQKISAIIQQAEFDYIEAVGELSEAYANDRPTFNQSVTEIYSDVMSRAEAQANTLRGEPVNAEDSVGPHRTEVIPVLAKPAKPLGSMSHAELTDEANRIRVFGNSFPRLLTDDHKQMLVDTLSAQFNVPLPPDFELDATVADMIHTLPSQ